MSAGPPSTRQTPTRIGRFSSASALYKVDFPIFFIESISERHVVIAGGGGSSKTGVHNQINILEILPTEGGCSAETVMKYQTPQEIPDAIMTGSLMRDRPIVETRLVSGGSYVTIYSFNYDPYKKIFCISDYFTLRDSSTRAELKTVKYAAGRILAGGIDGSLRCWKVTDDNQTMVGNEVKAHTKEIDDIDVDNVNQVIVTLSRSEGRIVTWSLETLKKIAEINSKSTNKSDRSNKNLNYIFRSCRYAYDRTKRETQSTDIPLLVACNPVPAKNNSSKICKWQTGEDNELRLTATGFPSTIESIMATTVSLDGRYVAVGTRSGGVSVLEVGRLRNIYVIEGAHYNAITDLEFLPPKPESLILTNSKSCPLLSVSIDRRVVLHRPKTPPVSIWLIKTFFMLLVIYLLVFILHNHYDITSYLRMSR